MRSRYRAAVVVSLLGAACGGGGGSEPPPENSPVTVSRTSLASGDAQQGTVGRALASPIRVVVTQGGVAAPGVTVNWSSTAAGARLTPASVATNADGVAAGRWTLGTVNTSQTAHATVNDANGSPVEFTAIAHPGTVVAMAAIGGYNQRGEINTQLAEPLEVSLTDEFGNPVGLASVAWAANGATVSAPVVLSDMAGISRVTVTLGGTPGPVTITAATEEFKDAPLVFPATATDPIPPAHGRSVTLGDNFSAATATAQ